MTPDPAIDIAGQVKQALDEDVGSGDLTAQLVDPGVQAQGRVITREDAVLCGRAWFDEVFRQVDPRVRVAWNFQDGDVIAGDQTLCTLHGPARALLTGERSALNF